MDKKIVSISSKRQITIPLSYFSKLGFGNKAECVLRGNELVIRPAKEVSGGEFAEQILADLISQGLSGDELLKQFKLKQAQVRPAIEKLIAEAEDAASGIGEYSSYEDIFGSEADT
ncbi:MAG: AbrB/MazE/SpoVT family DNA-binding domain-containing protein [Oscillospiraceae bacterium]|nr:AbrB/MazE/SpoVT family DNA-binding domain-containing protein [Oscillospiraceae bacterium]